MRIIIGTLFFTLVAFPHFIELSSPMRTREQTDIRGPEEASSSGHYHIEGSIGSYGTLIPYKKFTGPLPGSGLPEGKYRAMGKIEDLYHKVNNQYVPLTKNINLAIRKGIIYAVLIDGHVRPLYDKNGQHIIVSQATHRKIPIDEHEAAKMGFHQHFSQHFGSRP